MFKSVAKAISEALQFQQEKDLSELPRRPEHCKCGKFIGYNVCRVTLNDKTEICARCWHKHQVSLLVGPLHHWKAHVRDFLDAFRDLIPDARWLRLTPTLVVLA